MDFYAQYESEEDDSRYAIHDAVEDGDLELLAALFAKKTEPVQIAAEGVLPLPVMPTSPATLLPKVNERDENNCTPLHVAILNGQLEAMRMLLNAGARIGSKCEGCPPLHMTVCVGTHTHHAEFALEAVRLLITHGAVPLDRDDHGRTALHWAACSGLEDITVELLHAARVFSLSYVASQPDLEAPPSLVEFQDKQGNTAMHLAARYRHPGVLNILLEDCKGSSVATAIIKQRNKAGFNALHMAAIGGDVSCVQALLAAAPGVFKATTRQGRSAAELATRRGHADVAAALAAFAASQAAAAATASPTEVSGGMKVPLSTSGDPTTAHLANININSTPTSAHLRHGHHHHPRHTLIVSPPECMEHHTTPWPIVRGGPDPPPENVNRITVLTAHGSGSLRTVDFAEALRWDERPRSAPIADILRVHDWAYVRKVQALCEKLPNDPSHIGHLDGDTAISYRTYAAALAAAAASCHAVDEVVSGRVRNAFCPVRPPGHHAGPSGVVTCGKDPNGSHGFCLFNNAAIAAAYAMNVHRHAGIKRVAILDFDVHHGNGTEACVANTAPSVAKFSFSTPYGEGVQQFPVYKPWHDINDHEHIFFASVQGYGPKAPGLFSAYVYPGSGATCDTWAAAPALHPQPHELKELPVNGDDAPNAAAAAEQALATGKDDGGAPGSRMQNEPNEEHAGGANEQAHAEGNVARDTGNGDRDDDGDGDDDDTNAIEEDPDQEFVYDGGEMPRTEGPRIIDVGIPGFGPRVALWKRSWRDKILPALVRFDPDLIVISAGFDAHKKDEINFSYIGVQEKEYEWLTDQIVQVANRCCNGRVVSLLEGGYRIQGGVVSAFARSVAAHVRALAEPNGQLWDPRDARWERQHEKQLRAEAEAKRAAAEAAAEVARAAAAQAAYAAAEAAVHEHQVKEDTMGEEGESDDVAMLPVAEVAPAGERLSPLHTAAVGLEKNEDVEQEGDGQRRKRRRSAVDYVALNKKLEEEAGTRVQGGGAAPT